MGQLRNLGEGAVGPLPTSSPVKLTDSHCMLGLIEAGGSLRGGAGISASDIGSIQLKGEASLQICCRSSGHLILETINSIFSC